mgnify:FL=1
MRRSLLGTFWEDMTSSRRFSSSGEHSPLLRKESAMQRKIDLLPFIVEALGGNKYIYKDIDNLYQTDKYRFYQAAKSHELYTHQIVSEGGLLQEEYCKKALGILLCAGDEAVSEGLLGIFYKGWTYAYLFVRNHSEIDLTNFLKNAVRKAGGIDKVSDEWLNSQMFMVFFLAATMGKTVVQNRGRMDLQEILEARWHHYVDSPLRISINPENAEKIKQLKTALFGQFGKITNYIEMYGRLTNRAETIAFLFDFENLSFPALIDNIKLTEKDIDEILISYIVRNNSIDIKAASEYLCDAIYVKYMIKAYKETKQRYFENNKETLFVKLDGLEKELKISSAESTAFENAFKQSEKEKSLLQKEVERLNAELKKERRNRQELIGLREFLFSLDQKEEYREDEPFDLEELKTIKAVVVGGHERWQTQMKELLPSFIFIHPDNKSFDLRLLHNIPVVFIYVNYLNHAIYYRTMKAIEGTETKIYYINQKNINIVLNDIYRIKLKNESRE